LNYRGSDTSEHAGPCQPACGFAAWSEGNARQREANESLPRIEGKIDALRVVEIPQGTYST